MIQGNLLGFQSKSVNADENVHMMVNKSVKTAGLNAFGFPTSKTFSSTSIFGAAKCTQVTTQTVTSRNALGDIGNKITVSTTAGTIVSPYIEHCLSLSCQMGETLVFTM